MKIGIITILSLTDEKRMQMGDCGRKLIEEKYQWSAIGRQMVKAYEEILRKRKEM